MAAFENDDLIRYVLGNAETPIAKHIEEARATDPELQAKLMLMECFAHGTSAPDETTSKPFLELIAALGMRFHEFLFRRPRVAVTSLLLLLVAGAAYGGWVLATKPLLEDHFLRRSFDSTVWNAPRRHVRQEHGYVKITNRGYLVTQQEFDGPFVLSFRWRWLDLAEDPPYSEDLAVAIRTSGTPRVAWTHEAEDGVRIKFNTFNRNVVISWGTHITPNSFESARGSVPMPSDAWHDIRITDDGAKIAVYVSGPEIPREQSAKPVLEVDCDYSPLNRKIAFYNREMLAWTPHESHITDVLVRSLRP